MNYDLLIWDFDGTIADSLPRAAAIYDDLARSHGLVPISDTDAVRDMTIREFLRAHRVPLHRLPSLTAQFLAAQRDYSELLEVFPGLSDVIRNLSRCGVRMGIVSSNDQATIDGCLQQNDLESCFEFRVGCSRLFGKHRAIRGVVRGAAVEDRRALYVGDETRDVDSARKAGIHAGAVTWGFNSEKLLRQLEPAHLFHEPGEIATACGLSGESGDA